jgi:hypothetical protein
LRGGHCEVNPNHHHNHIHRIHIHHNHPSQLIKFLTRFEGSIVNAPVLEKLTLVDTPGVLSGQKQKLNRNYDFDQIVKWFVTSVVGLLLCCVFGQVNKKTPRVNDREWVH